MRTLSKQDITAIRKADRIIIRGNPSEVTLVKEERRTENNPFAQEVSYTLEDVPVTQYGSKVQGRNFSMVSLYRRTGARHATTILDSLREGDEITFEFYPDYATNGYMAKASLHGDALLLYIRRGKKLSEYVLETSNCADNEARMCYGVPYSDSVARWAKE